MTDIKENTSGQDRSREYKFRAWDGTWTHRMMYSDDTNLSAFFSRAGQTEYNKNIMQYTGLKDKNGVDIYNSDIIKYHGNSRVWEVYFDFGTLQYRVKSGNTNATYPLSILEGAYVVGNVYQNHELLSEK